jgi:mycofactocin system glycosyltransferase
VPLVLDPDVRRLDGGRVLLGGDPARLLRLRSASALDHALAGEPSAAVRALATTLVDGGFAHPRPGATRVDDVEVVVPVRDRLAELAACLAALAREVPVLVVDDGSQDPAAVARVSRRHGARVLHLPTNAGPAAARNAGLAATTASVVAFLDSDCLPPPGWIALLAGHLADPRVGAVAPRVRGRAPRGGVLASYAAARSPLDLGKREARVRPGARVAYVPTAALLVRRAALPAADPFDSALRYGEDVDLVWRLHDAGWTVRYDPRTVVEHTEPAGWGAWLRRRYAYGTSAGPLARRHGGRLAPLVLPPWHAASWVLLAAGRHPAAAAVLAVPLVRLARQLGRAGLPARTSAAAAAGGAAAGVRATATGIGGAGSAVTAPLLLALLLSRRTRRTAVVVLLAPPLLQWWSQRPPLDPLRWSLLRLLDDASYACGVWRGCWSARTVVPLRPRRRPPR